MMKRVKFSWFACLAALAACATPAEEEGPYNTAGSGGAVNAGGASGGGAGSSGGGAGGTMSGGSGGMSGGTGGGGAGMAGGTSGGAAGSAAPMCEGSTGAPVGTCADDATGVFAIKTVIDVWWQDEKNDPDLIDPGRSTITVYLKGEISCMKPDGSGGVGVMKACGTQLPPFKSDINCDAFQITFPDELWDKPSMPTFITTASTTGFEPGSILTIAEATGLLGIELDGGDESTWPKATSDGGFMMVDDDGDMKPGITIKMGRIGETFTEAGLCGAGLPFIFRGAPLETVSAIFDEGEKAETLYIGLRSKLGGGGEIGATCDSGTGDSTATYLDSRVFDCVTTMGMPCVNHPDFPGARDFVDKAAPNYHILAAGEAPPVTVINPVNGMPIDQTPSGGAKSSLVRVGDLGAAVDCAMVRGAAFP